MRAAPLTADHRGAGLWKLREHGCLVLDSRDWALEPREGDGLGVWEGGRRRAP